MSGQTVVFEEVYMTIYTITKWKYVIEKHNMECWQTCIHIFSKLCVALKKHNSNANGTCETENCS